MGLSLLRSPAEKVRESDKSLKAMAASKINDRDIIPTYVLKATFKHSFYSSAYFYFDLLFTFLHEILVFPQNAQEL